MPSSYIWCVRPIYPPTSVTQYSKFWLSCTSIFLDTASVVRTRSSGPDLTWAKQIGGCDPQLPSLCSIGPTFFRCIMLVMFVQVTTLFLPRPALWVDLLNGTLFVSTWYLLPTRPNFSPIATIGKKLIFSVSWAAHTYMRKMENAWCWWVSHKNFLWHFFVITWTTDNSSTGFDTDVSRKTSGWFLFTWKAKPNFGIADGRLTFYHANVHATCLLVSVLSSPHRLIMEKCGMRCFMRQRQLLRLRTKTTSRSSSLPTVPKISWNFAPSFSH